MYQANLQSFSTSLSLNITNTNKFQIGNFFRFGIEFELVPVYLGLDTDVYTSSVLNDNCFMMHGDVKIMRLDVTITKQFAKCSDNLLRIFTEATSLSDLFQTITSNPLILISPICEFDDTFGPNR